MGPRLALRQTAILLLVASLLPVELVMSQTQPWVAVSEYGMVASDSPHASEAGARILRLGGNAIDAAAATALALGVTRPYSAGLGGGGFLMVRLGDTGEVHLLDYRECAPGASTPDMFVRARAADPEFSPSMYGGLAVAVPGHLAGHAALLERFGSKPLYLIVEPAAELAEQGFPIDEHYRSVALDMLKTSEKSAKLKEISAGLRERLLFGGTIPPVGTRLVQPEMAQTLRAIGEHGPNVFYRGPIGEAIVRTVRRHGGLMTMEDLARYKPVWREPIRAKYRSYEVLLMPPPSSGGICIAQTLNILEHWNLASLRREDPGLAAHLTVEALKHAFADRARHLGDADFVEVPIEKLTSEAYAAELAKKIRLDGVSEANSYGWHLDDDHGTTHFCVADRWGTVVAATETINLTFGSLLVAEGTGIVLNDEMDDFTAEPGKPNAFGLRQSAQNAVAPYKRPLSSMSPTIVLQDGKPVLAVGASGGPRIITGTLQVMLNVIEYGMPVGDAIEQPRLHHQWQPNVVYRNRFSPDDSVIAGLAKRGHEISSQRREATVQALQIRDGKYIGASDPNKGGLPVGLTE